MKDIDPAGLSRQEGHHLLTSLFIPRPIALVGTVGPEGVFNCAPFSFANGVSSMPPVMSVAISDRRDGVPKDTLRNIRATGEFTISVVTEAILDRMHRSSAFYPPDVSEFEAVGLTPRPSVRVRAPGVAESPIVMECTLRAEIPIEGANTTLILADVRMFHIDQSVCTDGIVDPVKLRAVGRLGVNTYAVIDRPIRLPPAEVRL